MDIFSHFSDPLPFGSDSRQFNAPEMSSPSDGSSRPIGFSDEEVLLASTHPKRRADAKDIQKAAAEAAEAFRPDESDGVSSKDIGLKNVTTTPENVFYMDEEEPGLLASMAEGLLLSPPPCVGDGARFPAAENQDDEEDVAAEYTDKFDYFGYPNCLDSHCSNVCLQWLQLLMGLP
ncbi:hypothetical protein HHK36_027819 [Tetracentron sinense]|uniref:Uncharacterized protein n=1 Tax=Tetracentron sinense TaxID=13715 RepID=A0A835D1W5_TETSI|nr:hypothetical protein HHK36_027819 [Tetracentron sinense]